VWSIVYESLSPKVGWNFSVVGLHGLSLSMIPAGGVGDVFKCVGSVFHHSKEKIIAGDRIIAKNGARVSGVCRGGVRSFQSHLLDRLGAFAPQRRAR
jgi:hypothetical protein